MKVRRVISKRAGLIGMVSVVAVVATAAVVAQAGNDPTKLECADEFSSIGSIFPGPDSSRPTPREAAMAILEGMQADGKQIPVSDVVLMELPKSATAPVGSTSVKLAVRVDDKTLAIVQVSEGMDGWIAESYLAC